MSDEDSSLSPSPSPSVEPQPEVKADVSVSQMVDDVAKDMKLGQVPESTAAPEPKPESTPAPVAPAAAPAAPKTWTPAASAHWEKLPPDVQREILKRENDMTEGLKQYGPRAKIGDLFTKAVEPYLEHYQRANVNAWELIPAVLNAHAILSWGKPEEKVEMLRVLAKEAGLDLGNLDKVAPERDPYIRQLEGKIAELESGVRNVTQNVTEQQKQELVQQTTAFGNDPRNPYFWEVADDVAHLMEKGAETTLAGAYQTAIWRNPTVRAKLEAKIRDAAIADAQREAKAKADAAKNASAHRVVSRETPGGTTKVGSIDDTLKETLATIHARG